jgi:hypothetical protein
MATVDLKPSEEFQFVTEKGEVLLIACGALTREIVDLIERNRWAAITSSACPPNGATRRNSLFPPCVKKSVPSATNTSQSSCSTAIAAQFEFTPAAQCVT